MLHKLMEVTRFLRWNRLIGCVRSELDSTECCETQQANVWNV